jgi:hypothetical protein
MFQREKNATFHLVGDGDIKDPILLFLHHRLTFIEILHQQMLTESSIKASLFTYISNTSYNGWCDENQLLFTDDIVLSFGDNIDDKMMQMIEELEKNFEERCTVPRQQNQKTCYIELKITF